ncbi:MAG TPA: Hpt domain-containing protein, partial [Usitatibacter sp.]
MLRRTGTVSPLDIDVQKQKVQALYEDWKEAPAQETRERLEKAVGDLKRDATTVSDSAVAKQSEEALHAIQGAVSPQQTGVFKAIQGLAPDKAPETPTAQVVQLVDAPGAEVDKELLEIFLEEAREVVETIAASLETCREAPHDRESLTTIRRGFHTLKGSGRMVGLMALGELAWQCEQVMNKWLKEEKPASAQLLAFVDLARDSFSRWVGELQHDSAAAIDGTQITRQAEALKSEEEPAVAQPAPTAEVKPAGEAKATLAEEPIAAEALPQEPVEEAPPVEHEELSFESLVPQAPAPREEPAVAKGFDFESLDLGAAPPVTPPLLRPLAPAQLEDLVFPEAAAEPAAEDDVELMVGNVSISRTLFAIYLGEAEQHVSAMETQMAAIESDPLLPVSADFMRAAHTLASTSSTTGFESIAAVSHALEKWLQDAMEFPPEFNSQRLQTTRRAVDALTAMVQSIRGNAAPYPRDEVIAELDALRVGLREARKTGEGTHIKAPSYLRALLEDEAGATVSREEPAPAAPVEVEPHGAEVVSERGAEAPAFELSDEALAPAIEPIAPPAGIEPVAEPSVAAPAIESIVEPQVPVPPVAVPAASAPPLRSVGAPVAAAFPSEPATAHLGGAQPGAEPEVPESDKPFEAGKDQRKIKDDVDRDLLPVFLDEAREILPAVSEGVRRWKGAPHDHGPAADLRRHLHTLKGSARMTGLMRLGELAHVLEARVVALDEVENPPSHAFEEVEERIDRYSLSLERLGRGEDIVEAEPLHIPVSAVFEQQRDKLAALAMIAAAAQAVAQRDMAEPEAQASRAALLRVNADMIDRFVNEAGELSIARSRIEGEMAAFKHALNDLTDNIARMRAQLREIEIAAEGQMQSTIKLKEEHGEQFDPLEFDRFSRMQELTRFLAESLSDVITVHQGLQKNIDETELAIHAQARLNRELQQGLMGVRLVPLGNLADRFYRIVRQTAKELDKKANLELKGTRTELDRSVLEKITAPFEHLLRNAIAHGLEKPEARLAAGKAEIGEISIDAVQRGNEVVLTVADDGAGLNFPRIREKAVAAGLLAPDIELPEAQLAQFIFMSGFSTATEITQISGRGVGMDVVKNEITALGGRVEIASAAGRGTTFTITLPLTLAVTQAVMLRAGPTLYAVPSVMVEQVQEFKASAFGELAAKGELVWKDNRYPLRSLLPLLGEIDTATPPRQIPVLLLKSGTQRAAIRVDEIVGNREVVVKTIGPQLSRLAGIAGATVLGNGQVVLILNPVQLVHRAQGSAEVSVEAPKP